MFEPPISRDCFRDGTKTECVAGTSRWRECWILRDLGEEDYRAIDAYYLWNDCPYSDEETAKEEM